MIKDVFDYLKFIYIIMLDWIDLLVSTTAKTVWTIM